MGENKYFGMVWSSKEFVKKVCVSEIDGPRRGRPVVKWRDSVKEYMHERGVDRVGVLEQARRDCMYSKRWRLFCSGYHPLRGRSQRRRGVRKYR